MDYRKMLKRIIAVCVSIVLAFGFAACRNGDDDDGGGLGDISIGTPTPGDEPSDIGEPGETGDPGEGEGDGPIEDDEYPSIFSDVATGAIGETFNFLKGEHPGYDTQIGGTDAYMEFGGAAFPYLGAPDAMYNYVFFGTQWGPSLGDVASYFGDEMECIGVIAKLGVIFPYLDWDLTFEDFFDDYIMVEDYYVYDWGSADGPVVGQIYFQYLGFDVTIRGEASHASETLKEGFYTLMTEGDITRNEGYLQRTHEMLEGM